MLLGWNLILIDPDPEPEPDPDPDPLIPGWIGWHGGAGEKIPRLPDWALVTV